MCLTAGPSWNPDISIGIAPAVTTSIRVPNPIRSTLGFAIAFSLTRHPWGLRTVWVRSVLRGLCEDQISEAVSNQVATNPADDCSHKRAWWATNGKPAFGPQLHTKDRVLSGRVDTANRIAAHI